MLNHKMVNITTCYLLVVSSLFIYSLATDPAGEGSSGSGQQQHSKDPSGFSLSANAQPYVTQKRQQQQQQQQQAVASPFVPLNTSLPSIPIQQPLSFQGTLYFLHQGTQHFPIQGAQHFVPLQAMQHFPPHGMPNFPALGTQYIPPQETQLFHPPRGAEYFRQNKNLPPRLRQQQQQYRRRESVPMDLPASAAGPSSTSAGNANNNNNALVAHQPDSMTPGTSSGNPANADSRGWRLWNFESPEIKSPTSEQWKKYLHKTDQRLFAQQDVMDIASLNLKLPSDLAKEISPNKRVGMALFREGIVPFGAHPTCQNGGFFYMSFLTSTGKGNNVQPAKIDQIFNSLVSLALHGLPEPLKGNVTGIFVRANIHVVNNPTEHYNNNNPEDLPCRFVFEFWIRDKRLKNEFRNALNNGWIEEQKERGIGVKKFKFWSN